MCGELETTEFNKFICSDGSTAKFFRYSIVAGENVYDVYVFHSQVQPYSRRGLCLKLPQEMSRSMDYDRRQYLAVVQLMSYGEEAAGAEYIFHRFLRTGAGYDYIPIPAALVDEMDMRIWTVAISLLDKLMLLQYDGFIYPDVLTSEDPLGVCEALRI